MTTAKSKTAAAPADQPAVEPADEPGAGAGPIDSPGTFSETFAPAVDRASKGVIVFVPSDPALNNGDDEAPAIVTRVWDNGLINVRVFPDSNKIPEWRTSVKLHEQRPDEPGHDAWWRPRVG